MESMLATGSEEPTYVPVKPTEKSNEANFMGGIIPPNWGAPEKGAFVLPAKYSNIQNMIQTYNEAVKGGTDEDTAAVQLGQSILSQYQNEFNYVFGPYTNEQAMELFKNKPMQVIQGLVGGIPYSSNFMPNSIAQTIKEYARLIPGASVGKGGGLYRTIKIPKGITNRPTKYHAPNPVMILMQITNFLWHLCGMPGMAPYVVSQAAMAYYRSLIGFDPSKNTMTKADISNILSALEANHTSLMKLFYESQVYSRAAFEAKNQIKAKAAEAKQEFKDLLGTLNTYAAGQSFFGKLLATAGQFNVTSSVDTGAVKSNMLLNYGNPIAKPVKLPRGVGYYGTGTGANIQPVKLPSGNTYTFNNNKWNGNQSLLDSYNTEQINGIVADMKKNVNADLLAQSKVNAAAIQAAKQLLTQNKYNVEEKKG